MKKLFALLLALALMIGCFAGCAKKEEPQEEPEDVQEEAEVEEKTEEPAPEEVPEEPVDAEEEVPEDDGVNLGGLLDALGDAEGDIGEIIGVISDEFGDEILAELEALGLSEYLGSAGLDIAGDVTIGTYRQLLMIGFESDVDPETVLPAGTVSDEFTVRMGEAGMDIRVANPKEEDIPIGDGIVCYYHVESALMGAVGGYICGTATREDVLKGLGAPYDSDEDSLTYHTTALGTVDWGAIAETLGITEFEDDFSRTLTFVFEDAALVGIIMEAPFYLYGGLEDNIDEEDRDDLEEMTAEEIEEIVEIRDSILERLTEELAARDIDVTMDARTGEIVLGDSILFAHDSADLTEEGKDYLDKLFAAYAAVILDDEYTDSISKILVEGHASPQGSHEYNLDLSQRRADNVRGYCMQSAENGLSDTEKNELDALMEARGLSFTDPVFDENGDVDFDASRRVSIKFFITVTD